MSRRQWTIEFANTASGRATAFSVNARAADVADGRAARVEWTNAEGVRIFTQALIVSYAHEFAAELTRNHGRGSSVYEDVAVVPVPALSVVRAS